jgi:SAM-dependent methyltransferase
MTLDWGDGDYGPTGRSLVPAAEAVVAAAALRPGERVVDVGCGTGNVAGMAAAAGAAVTAVDPSARLLERAERSMPPGTTVRFALGDAEHLPLPDASCDAVLSNFAVIFAPDPAAAVAELCRVAAPGGRIVFSAWLPSGRFAELMAEMARFRNETQGTPLPPPRFPWWDPDAVQPLFDAVGDRRLRVSEHEIAFTSGSPEEHYDEVFLTNPVNLAGVAAARAFGRYDVLRGRLIAVLNAANEDPTAFRATSRYVVVRAA